jgi:two-component system sensor histidine kinase BaeS
VYQRDNAHLAPILEETRGLSTLIEDLRTLALAGTGTLKLQKESTDLDALVEEAVSAYRPQAKAKGISLEAESADELRPFDVDPARIHQVLANVLGNALRHTDPGGRVRLVTAQEAGPPVRVTISVTGTGGGITPEDLPHIFDRFYRSPDSRGTGPGLAIAKNLVALHGGTTSAESSGGRGTTLLMTLPLIGDDRSVSS